MPITTNNPIGPVDSLAALKALLSGGSMQNAANPAGYVQGAANRDKRLTEMRHNLSKVGPGFSTGATPLDAQDLEQDIQEDPYTGAAAHQNVAEEEALNQKMQQYGRPDVTAARGEAQNFALQRLLAPLHVKGQYDVAAAGARANAAEESQTRGFANQAAHDERMMQGTADRTAQSNNLVSARNELQGYLTGKVHAPNTSWFGGGQEALDAAEIARLRQKISGGNTGAGENQPSSGTMRVRGPNGETGSVPVGTPLPAGWSQQ